MRLRAAALAAALAASVAACKDRPAPPARPVVTRWVFSVKRQKTASPADAAQQMSKAAHALELRAVLIGIQGARVVAAQNEIYVDLPAIDADTADRLLALCERRGVLEFVPVVDDPPRSKALADAVLDDKSDGASDVRVATEPWFAPGTHKEHKVPHLEADDRDTLAAVLDEIDGVTLAAPFDVGLGEAAPANGAGGPRWRTWLLDRRNGLLDPVVERARAETSRTASQPLVILTFAPETAKRFAELTRKHKGEKLAIVVDDEVESAPIIQEPIVNGRAIVTMGRDTPKDATDLAVVLGSGRLPYAIERKAIIDRHTGKPPAGS